MQRASTSCRDRIPFIHRDGLRRALLLATTALTGSLIIGSAQAQNLPTGGSVAAGSVAIAQPSATQLNITQSSQSAIVNWQSFSIGQGSAVNIQQPNSGSAMLGRVTGNTPSSIAGSLTANGQVYLVNPNGIAITSTGVVNIGGGFVASTLGISDADFQSGKRTFTGNGASAGVSNAGIIAVGRRGYAALLGGTVSNAGRIIVPLGKVGLGSGESATLDFSGDGFLQVALPTAAGGSGPLISNSGSIRANGGSVIISAATAREAARNAVNISGLVEARSIGGQSGSIFIGGGAGGNVNVSGRLSAIGRQTTGGAVAVTGQNITLAGATIDTSGKLGGGSINIGGGSHGQGPLQQADTVTIDHQTTIRADATAAGNGGNVVVWSNQLTTFAGAISARGGTQSGDGGNAEVSGKAVLDYTGFTDLSAANGAFGTLLLDPFNVIISNGANNTGGSVIANTNDSIINIATLQTALGAANVAITTGNSGTQAGNITVAAPLTWSAATLLALDAAGAIAINAPITITGAGGIVLNATAQPGVTTTGLTFGNGASIDYGATNNGGRFKLNGINYILVYTMAELDAIDGVNAVNGAHVTTYGAGLTGAYALATNFIATGTTYTRALIGTNSSGTTTTEFRGLFDGLGHTITGLTINAPGTDYIGLFGYFQNGSISNIGLVGGSVIGGDNVGALIGEQDDGVVQTSFATTAVTGSLRTGGLIGTVVKEAVLQSSYATGAVTGTSRTGGLVGEVNFGGILQNDYATGAVAGSDTTGGLVGYYSQSSVAGSIQTSYSSGAVTGATQTGGLIGETLTGSGATTTDASWNIQTSGVTTSDGGTGLSTAQVQAGLPAGFSASVWGTGSGLVLLSALPPAPPLVVISQPAGPPAAPASIFEPASDSFASTLANMFQTPGSFESIDAMLTAGLDAGTCCTGIFYEDRRFRSGYFFAQRRTP
jgi:filamentous hemagglutinin family protein